MTTPSQDLMIGFTLDLTDDEDAQAIRRRVSFDLLEVATGSSNIEKDQALRLLDSLKERVRGVVDMKIRAHEFESDGSILLRSADLN